MSGNYYYPDPYNSRLPQRDWTTGDGSVLSQDLRGPDRAARPQPSSLQRQNQFYAGPDSAPYTDGRGSARTIDPATTYTMSLEKELEKAVRAAQQSGQALQGLRQDVATFCSTWDETAGRSSADFQTALRGLWRRAAPRPASATAGPAPQSSPSPSAYIVQSSAGGSGSRPAWG